MIILAVILTICSYLAYIGYGLIVLFVLGLLYLYCYYNAPSRKFPTAEEITAGVDLTGKVAFVTGTTSGIGYDTAKTLALRGAKVYLASRNPTKLNETKQQMVIELQLSNENTTTTRASTSSRNSSNYDNRNYDEMLIPVTCDLNDLNSVKAAAETFLKNEIRLDILINNAGVMTIPEFRPTVQGLEQQVGICHVGHFYLTKLLLMALQKSKSHLARVVCVSSSAHRNHKFNDLLKNNPRLETVPYDPKVAYGNAKSCNMFHAKELHERYYQKLTPGRGSGKICAFSVMPGGIFTGLQKDTDRWTMFKWKIVGPFFFKSTSQGAATSLLCATKADPDKNHKRGNGGGSGAGGGGSGEYYDNCQPTDCMSKMEEEVGKDASERLWTITEDLLKTLGFS